MSKKKAGFWARLFGKKRPSSPQNITIPQVELSRDPDWAGQTGEEIVDPVYLRQLISNYFSLTQLHDTAAKFGISPKKLNGGKGRQVLDVITAVSNQNKLPELLEACQQLLPNIPWDRAKQIKQGDGE